MENKKQNLKEDLKKIIPIWLGLLCLIISGIIILKLFSLKIINYLEYPEMKISQIAQSYFLEGEKYWLNCINKIDAMTKKGDKPIISKDDKDYQKAMELFNKSLSFTEIPKIYNYMADLSSFADDRISLNFYQGMSIIAEKKPVNLAEEYFKECLNLKKDFLPAIEKLAIIYYNNRNQTEADKYTKEYIQYSPNSAIGDYLLGRMALLYNNIDEAIQLFKSAINKDQKYLNAYDNLTSCLDSKKLYDEECAVLEKANKEFPNHPTYLHTLGLCYMKANKPEKARDAIKKALDLIPNHAQLNFDLAKVYQKLGKKYYASYYLKKAIEIDPKLQNEILK